MSEYLNIGARLHGEDFNAGNAFNIENENETDTQVSNNAFSKGVELQLGAAYSPSDNSPLLFTGNFTAGYHHSTRSFESLYGPAHFDAANVDASDAGGDLRGGQESPNVDANDKMNLSRLTIGASLGAHYAPLSSYVGGGLEVGLRQHIFTGGEAFMTTQSEAGTTLSGATPDQLKSATTIDFRPQVSIYPFAGSNDHTVALNFGAQISAGLDIEGDPVGDGWIGAKDYAEKPFAVGGFAGVTWTPRRKAAVVPVVKPGTPDIQDKPLPSGPDQSDMILDNWWTDFGPAVTACTDGQAVGIEASSDQTIVGETYPGEISELPQIGNYVENLQIGSAYYAFVNAPGNVLLNPADTSTALYMGDIQDCVNEEMGIVPEAAADDAVNAELPFDALELIESMGKLDALGAEATDTDASTDAE